MPKRIVYSVPGMEQIKPRANLTYKRVAGIDHKMDVYSPAAGTAASSRRPAVIFIHGGPVPANLLTRPKDWGVFTSYGQLLAASGLVAVTFNHRLHSFDALNDAQSDVADLIGFVRDNADTFGIDKDRICLWAFSGGGPFLSKAMRDTPPYVKCIVSYYALLDLKPLRQQIPPAITDQMLTELSPLHFMSINGAKIAPIFIARAGLDNPGLNGTVDQFVQEALARNATIDVSNHPKGHHGFDILDDDERSREIIGRTIAFIKSHCEL